MDISRDILQFLHYHPLSSRDEIARGTAFEGSDATMKRLLAAAVVKGDVVVEGKARATRYRLSDQAHLLMPRITPCLSPCYTSYVKMVINFLSFSCIGSSTGVDTFAKNCLKYL